MSSSTATLYPPSKRDTPTSSPLPQLLQTPSGLALLELQGTVNLPINPTTGEPLNDISVGRLDFPDYDPTVASTDWMKNVHLYVGQHQRLTGEVKKLPRAMAVVRRRENQMITGSGGSYREKGENLEVVEIVKYVLKFSHRPEPVGTANAPA